MIDTPMGITTIDCGERLDDLDGHEGVTVTKKNRCTQVSPVTFSDYRQRDVSYSLTDWDFEYYGDDENV